MFASCDDSGTALGTEEAADGVQPVESVGERDSSSGPIEDNHFGAKATWLNAKRSASACRASTMRTLTAQSWKINALRVADAVGSAGTYAAPVFMIPNIEATASADFRIQMPTRSPGPTRSWCKWSRTRSDRRASSP